MTTTTIHLLTITNPSQLAEFCSMIIPCIWAGSLNSNKRQIFSSPKRHNAFKLFVQKVLKATQISCTCMILALYYIQRLRTAYPSIRASIGSEVRLFTTALVLANKYLDDNTFTNKTWSEVSSIPVNELNIMEMEFLSALNYTIHIPHLQFFEWSNTCQQWWNKYMVLESSLPPTPVSTPPPSTSLKRSYNDYEEEPYSKKRYIHAVPPITPVIHNTQQVQQQPPVYNMIQQSQPLYLEQQRKKFFFSMDQLYYPSNTTSNLNTANYVCKPILSWSSSVSALSSSKYNNNNHSNPYLTN